MALEPKTSESARAGMAQAREDRQKAREAARDVAVKGMRERQREQDEANAESYRRKKTTSPRSARSILIRSRTTAAARIAVLVRSVAMWRLALRRRTPRAT
jgi:hypothetical protein